MKRIRTALGENKEREKTTSHDIIVLGRFIFLSFFLYLLQIEKNLRGEKKLPLEGEWINYPIRWSKTSNLLLTELNCVSIFIFGLSLYAIHLFPLNGHFPAFLPKVVVIVLIALHEVRLLAVCPIARTTLIRFSLSKQKVSTKGHYFSEYRRFFLFLLYRPEQHHPPFNVIPRLDKKRSRLSTLILPTFTPCLNIEGSKRNQYWLVVD